MLLEKIQQASTEALRAKEDFRLGLLRMILAQCKNKAIDKRAELTDEEIIQVLRKEIKKRQDSIVLYEQGKRPELAAAEAKEITIIEEFVPKMLTANELEDKVKIIFEAKQLAGQNFGQQMKIIMAELAGQAEGGEVSQIIKKLNA